MGEKSLLCDPGSELRLGERENRRAKTIPDTRMRWKKENTRKEKGKQKSTNAQCWRQLQNHWMKRRTRALDVSRSLRSVQYATCVWRIWESIISVSCVCVCFFKLRICSYSNLLRSARNATLNRPSTFHPLRAYAQRWRNKPRALAKIGDS